jgi:hypothetical protein
MPDLLAKGADMLAQSQRHYVSSKVAYTRGTSVSRIPATRGRTEVDVVDAAGMVLREDAWDFIIHVDDMKIDGIRTEPANGDRIIVSDTAFPNREYTFEVMGIAGGPPFRFADEYRRQYRIHTKLVEKP